MNKKKLCCFYVNDIHLITMLLPYINQRINESTKVIPILETDMSRGVEKVIDKIQGMKSKNLLQIDWKNKSLEYLEKCDIKDRLILICGSDEFMSKANEIVSNRKESCTILNCYEMIQANLELEQILNSHDKVVNTSGEKDPKEFLYRYSSGNSEKLLCNKK